MEDKSVEARNYKVAENALTLLTEKQLTFPSI